MSQAFSVCDKASNLKEILLSFRAVKAAPNPVIGEYLSVLVELEIGRGHVKTGLTF